MYKRTFQLIAMIGLMSACEAALANCPECSCYVKDRDSSAKIEIGISSIDPTIKTPEECKKKCKEYVDKMPSRFRVHSTSCSWNSAISSTR